MKNLFRIFPAEKRQQNRSNMRVRIREMLPGEFPFNAEVMAENLYIPWALDVSDKGEIYFTERPGTIRKIVDGELYPQPLITFRPPFTSQGEGGLMGIALDPDFSQNHYIYVMYSYMEGNQIYNRVVRLLEQNNTVYIDQILIDQIPGGSIHNGGRIKIGPDQKLYVTTGDTGNASLAQDLNSLAGKILRINLDGSIPADNPFPNSPIYSYGHRNPQGLTWNTKDNVMYASEHGSAGHDEINLIKPGGNYGWPLDQRVEIPAGVKIVPPLINSGTETWAPSGIAYLNQGPWQGKLLVATLRGQELLAMPLNNNGTEIRGVETWLRGQYGRLRDVVQAKDGSIYISTSNRDGRGGVPRPGDDKIVRLTPINASV